MTAALEAASKINPTLFGSSTKSAFLGIMVADLFILAIEFITVIASLDLPLTTSQRGDSGQKYARNSATYVRAVKIRGKCIQFLLISKK